jgi:hypothetical protein
VVAGVWVPPSICICTVRTLKGFRRVSNGNANQTVEKVCRRRMRQLATPKTIGVFGCCPSGLSFARIRGQGPWMAKLFGTTYAGETASSLRVSPARGRRKSRRRARIRPTLLERSPTPEPTRPGSNPRVIFREGCPCPEGRRGWPAEPWMAERRQLRTSEGLEGRSECPATEHGHPDLRWTSVFPA